MSFRAAGFVGTTIALCLAVGSGGRTATAATVVAYNFSGTITTVSALATSATGVIVGDTISGTFAYDSSQTGSGGVYTFTGSSKTHSLSFRIYNSANVQMFSDQYTGNGTLQSAGYFADKVTYTAATQTAHLDMVGDTTYKQGLGQTFYNSGIPAYDLSLTYPSSTGFSATNLPLPGATVIPHFLTTKGTLTWDPAGQYFTADITSFSPVGAPEPSGLVMAVIGLSTCAAGSIMARRKRRTASPVDGPEATD